MPLHATKGGKKLHGKVNFVFSKVVFETMKLILLGWKAGSHSCARHSCCRGAGEKKQHGKVYLVFLKVYLVFEK